MTLHVFEVRGVFLFRYDGDEELPRSVSRHYNEVRDRYEVPTADALADLPVDYERVDDPDRFRVRFRGDPPGSVRQVALLVDDGPTSTTVLCPDEETVERALDAGGERVT